MRSSRPIKTYTVKEREPVAGDILLLALASSLDGVSWRLARVLKVERTKTHKWTEVREGKVFRCSRTIASKTGKLEITVQLDGYPDPSIRRFHRYALLSDSNALWLSALQS